ncbi:unnamed protein product [Parnassius mnemosyne]|uniref:Cytosolic beta-glucosidase n=1 Tax=Parnassius mnemosyne TaxID=213953 RepID=A0AAV1LK77_9NEOP
MNLLWCLIYICLIGVEAWSDNKRRKFSNDFKFGVSTSAYQVEGAWNVDGKGESIWDRYFHDNPNVITDGRNGDEACDSYHKYKRDVEMLRELGVDYYRFSISWPRVLPSGFPNEQNKLGFQYYDNLIDELLKYNIMPMVTLYHFDLPQKLQDLGGWANPHSVDWFVDYVRVVFDRYASKVKHWITINQPNSICTSAYGETAMTPDLNKGITEYQCTKNILLAHAMAYRLYQKEYKNKYKGSVGISMSLNWADPVDNSTENVEATEVFRGFNIDLFLNPIWSKNGDFPSIVKKIVAEKSKQQGFSKSRLPVLSPEEIELLRGSADFLGVNHYTTDLVKASAKYIHSPSFENDVGVEIVLDEKRNQSQPSWLRSAPYGLYKLCIYINQNYDYPTIYITENGWSTKTGLWDRSRVENMRLYLNALLLAIEDGTTVKGYTVWSLMDNVEWQAGTSERFGLYEVDFDSRYKKRTARMSALVYKRIIQSRIVEKDWEPRNLYISSQY